MLFLKRYLQLSEKTWKPLSYLQEHLLNFENLNFDCRNHQSFSASFFIHVSEREKYSVIFLLNTST